MRSRFAFNEGYISRLESMWKLRVLHRLFFKFFKTVGIFSFSVVLLSWAHSKYINGHAASAPVAVLLAVGLAVFVTLLNCLVYFGPYVMDEESLSVEIGGSKFLSKDILGYSIEKIDKNKRFEFILLLELREIGIFPIHLALASDKEKVREIFSKMSVNEVNRPRSA